MPSVITTLVFQIFLMILKWHRSSTSRQPLSQLSVRTFVSPGNAAEDHDRTLTVVPGSLGALLGSKLPFKSHSSPRPPQTPAASS